MKVIVLGKSGKDPYLVASYRTISLLLYIVSCFEHIILHRILTVENLLSVSVAAAYVTKSL